MPTDKNTRSYTRAIVCGKMGVEIKIRFPLTGSVFAVKFKHARLRMHSACHVSSRAITGKFTNQPCTVLSNRDTISEHVRLVDTPRPFLDTGRLLALANVVPCCNLRHAVIHDMSRPGTTVRAPPTSRLSYVAVICSRIGICLAGRLAYGETYPQGSAKTSGIEDKSSPRN